MRSPIIVVFLVVGVAYASNNPGWKENKEYIYKVNGRSLARAFESSDQYSGVLIKATLKIQPRPEGKLYALISEPRYSQIHSKLSHGWNTLILESDISWRSLPLSSNPFLIEMKDGVITDLVVNEDTSNWEANMLKGIVSQFQLNTNGRNPSQSHHKNDQNSAVFVTMEDTVSGNTATLYEVRPLPEHVVQYRQGESGYLDSVGDGEVIEVIKHKNYSEHVELPSYFYGFGDVATWEGSSGEPATNNMGRFVVRDTTSRAILVGSLREYIVQNSVTTNKVFLSPNFYDKQMGSVISTMNVTLESMKPQAQKIPEIYKPVNLGNLVYTYGTLSKTKKIQAKRSYQIHDRMPVDLSESHPIVTNMLRMKRDIGEHSETSYRSYKLKKPQLSEAPRSPFLPFTTGNKGQSIKEGRNILNAVIKLTKQISTSMHNSENINYERDLDRFVTLTSLIRIMDSNEVELATNTLYSNSVYESKRAAWAVYRDALSQSGTGPAFLCIKKLIETNKLRGVEASQVIATLAYAIREPTLQYMRAYFELIKTPQVQSEWPLNDTALLTFTDLIRRVYVDKRFSDNHYPEKSFGTFWSREGEQFVREEVVSHLTRKLNEAVAETETHKIHTYIRALGNIADPEILSTFEPYLEGRKQISQFQRLLIILSMEKIVITHPKPALSLLFRVYENPGESPEVRTASVYQIMRCSPSVEVLQIMASYTNTDPQVQVNAAVKDSVRRAAELEGEEFHTLRYAAQAAKPLLTEKEFGIQSGANYLRSYLDEELKTSYKQNAQLFGSEDTLLPRGFRYTLREDLNGMKRNIGNIQAFVSSLEELVHVMSKNYGSYRRDEEEQKLQFENQQQYPWSSAYINRILNMKATEREQLEGNLLAEFGSIHRMFSFDNMTIEQFPEVLRKWEEDLTRGVKFNSFKVMNNREMALSFPTEIGLPFLFTRDAPTMMKVQGKLTVVSTPKISQGGKIYKPDNVRVTSNMSITVTTKVQSRLTLTTPFDGHQYTAGYDKHLQVYVPVSGVMEIDVKQMKTLVELIPKKTQGESKLFHYQTWPYTSKSEIGNFEPLSLQPDTKIIIPVKDLITLQNTFGKRETGIAFKVEIERSKGSIDGVSLWRLFGQKNLIFSVMRLWDANTIQYTKVGVAYLPQESPIHKAIFRLGYRQEYSKQGETASNKKWNLDDYKTSSQRQEKLIEDVSAEIDQVTAYSLDATADFYAGDHTLNYILTGAVGKSNVDPKSRILVSYKNSSDNSAMKPYEAHLISESSIPNTNALDMDYSFKFEPTADTHMEFKFGPSQETLSKIDLHLKYRRSEERKQYLELLPIYYQCKQEIREGNKQLSACVNITTASNLMDRINMKVLYKNLKPELEEAFRTLYEATRFNFLPSLTISRQQSSLGSNEIVAEAQFHPDLKHVNISVKTQAQESAIGYIPVSDFAKETFVSHPVFHLRSRYMGYLSADQFYGPMCVVDRTKVNTFSNSTYSADISKHWTLVLQYVPKEARHEYDQTIETQLKHQLENYAILVRQNTDPSKKDFKITVSSPRTEFKVFDYELTPSESSDSKVRVTVRGKEVSISEDEPYQANENFIHIYKLPNGEVKLEVFNAFYIIYDGSRAKLTITNYKFKDSTRGLCGQFNGQSNEDFLTSENCFARDPKKFIKSFEVEGEEGKKVRREFSGRTSQCVEKITPLYVDVSGNSVNETSTKRPSTCTIFRTKYVQHRGDICFTVNAMPACSRHCQPSGYVSKSVPVHCVKLSEVAVLWKSQIDMGASPDFTKKEEHKSVPIDVPETCSQ